MASYGGRYIIIVGVRTDRRQPRAAGPADGCGEETGKVRSEARCAPAGAAACGASTVHAGDRAEDGPAETEAQEVCGRRDGVARGRSCEPKSSVARSRDAARLSVRHAQRRMAGS